MSFNSWIFWDRIVAKINNNRNHNHIDISVVTAQSTCTFNILSNVFFHIEIYWCTILHPIFLSINTNSTDSSPHI